MTQAQAFRTGFFAALGVAALALLLLAGWYFLGAVLSIATPFVVAVVVALLLDPLVDWVQARTTRKRRLPAVFIVFLLFLLGFVGLLMFLVPNLMQQAGNLAENFPVYLNRVEKATDDWLSTHRQVGSVTLPENLRELVGRYSGQVSTVLRASIGHMVGIVLGSVSRLLSVVLIPIITFYLLVDIDRLRARFLFLLPEGVRGSFQRSAADVGDVFGHYVRGLMIVCSAYAAVAVIVLLALGLEAYALLLGVAAGALYAVPYLGAAITLLLASVISLAQGGGGGKVAAVVFALVVLTQVFDNLITPRVVGGKVGLHPVLSLFALILGGELFGLWGMLLAVPMAASIQVVLYRLFPRLTAPTPLSLLSAESSPRLRTAPDVVPEAVPPAP